TECLKNLCYPTRNHLTTTLNVSQRRPHPPLFNRCAWVSDRRISTSQLHTLLRSHIWPINPVVYRAPQRKSHLESGFPLRCFQLLSFPNVANQPCTWRYNWHTRGSSVPVLSY